MKPLRGILILISCLALPLFSAATDDNTPKGTQNMPKDHFVVVSSARKPAPGEIAAYLEPAWQTFHDVFGVDPEAVKVVVSVTAGAGAPPSQADPDRSGQAPTHEIAWAMKEGEPLSSQTFSDLAHEITHIYFIDYMEDQGGLHQAHAWLHEAVACYAERDPFRRNREQWARDHLSDRIPLAQLFTMTNPQKTNPLVELTVKLQEQLARGEIKVEDMNRQIADFATTHATELHQAGIRNMTYYSESLSLFEFLLQTQGKAFLRTMCQTLKAGKSMDDVLRSSKAYPRGVPQLEEAWVASVQKE
jgi:hypothetical protein